MARYPRRFGSSAARAQSRAAFAAVNGAIPALTISGVPAAGSVGSGDTFTPTIAGGSGPYTLSVASGTLPPGRTISGLTVTGSYTTAGTYSYTLRVTDSKGATANLPITVTVGAAAASERHATAGTRDPGGVLSSGSNTVVRIRRRVVCFANVPWLRYTHAQFYVDNNGVEQPIVQPAGTEMAFSLECPGASTALNRFRFAGAASVTDPTGRTVPTDQLLASAFGLANFAKTGIYWLTEEYYNPNGGIQIPVYESSNPEASNISGEAFYMTTGTLGRGDVDTPGGLPSRGASATQRQSHPYMLTGPHSDAAILYVGDSIAGGRGSTKVAGDGGPAGTSMYAQGGYAAQGLYAAQVPHHLSTKPGCQGSQYTATNAAQRVADAVYASKVIDAYGINDVSAGLSAAAILADDDRRSLLWLGVKSTLDIYRTTISTKTTGNWATLSGQTVSAGFAATGSVRSTVNAGRYAAVGTNNLRAIFDFNSFITDATETDKYRPHGATGTAAAASSASTTITLSAPQTGAWAVGQYLAGAGLSVGNTKIIAQVSGTAGGAGDYTLSIASTVASGAALTADSATIDGLHPDQALHDRAAAGLRTFVLANVNP